MELPEKMSIFFLSLWTDVPELFSQFKRDILSIVEFLIEFLLQFLIYAFVLLLSEPGRSLVDNCEGPNKTNSTSREDLRK